jgi:hypothetical protein
VSSRPGFASGSASGSGSGSGSGLGDARLPVIAVTGMAFEARIARGPGVESVFAARSDLLERAISEALARGCSGIISFGTAGGLSPELEPGTVIIASSVSGPFGVLDTDPEWSARLFAAFAGTPLEAKAVRGTMAGVAAPLTGEQQKSSLIGLPGRWLWIWSRILPGRLLRRGDYRLRFAGRLLIRLGGVCRVLRRPGCGMMGLRRFCRSCASC